jgi:hypothetical protein
MDPAAFAASCAPREQRDRGRRLQSVSLVSPLVATLSASSGLHPQLPGPIWPTVLPATAMAGPAGSEPRVNAAKALFDTRWSNTSIALSRS